MKVKQFLQAGVVGGAALALVDGTCAAIAAGPAGPPETAVPFQMVTLSGQRLAVKALLNGHPITFVIHSNAGQYIQISHADADSAHITDLVHVDSYGIVERGKVSALGRDSAHVAQLTIGRAVFRQVPATVFETPAGFGNGMLACAG